MPAVIARDVFFDYKTPGEQVHALRGVDLVLEPGRVTCIMGASGSGKSTLLKVLAGLEIPKQGEVTVLGEELTSMTERERTRFRLNHVGMVFQDHMLIDQLTAAENVEILLQARGVQACRSVALEALDAVGLDGLGARRPSELSGGQRQRVGVARALAGGRQILLCDEPTGSLDRSNATNLFSLIQQAARSINAAVLIATHDEVAIQHCDMILCMSDGLLTQRDEDS